MDTLKRRKWEIGAFALLLLNFAPLLSMFFYGDDMTSSDWLSVVLYRQKDALWYFQNSWVFNLINVGRFYPLHIIQRHFVFVAFAENIWLYRAFICMMNVLAVGSTAWMVKAFSGSRRYACAVLLLFPAVLFQLSKFDDAVTSYYGFIQCLVIYLSLSLLLLKRYTETQRRVYLTTSVVLYVLSLLTYETSYPLLLCYPAAAYFLLNGERRARRTIMLSLPYLAVMLISLGCYVWFAKHAVYNYGGISASLDIPKIIVTLLKQMSAALPMAAHRFRWQSLWFSPSPLDILTALLAGVLFWTLPRGTVRPRRALISLIAALMLIMPSLTIALSSKYQTDTQWGQGYLQLFIARFGILLLAFTLYDLLCEKLGKRHTVLKMLGVLVVVAVQFFTLGGNREVVAYKNTPTVQRQFVESVAGDGLFNLTNGNVTVICKNQWWSALNDERRSAVLSRFSGHHINAFFMPEYIAKHGTGGSNLFWLDYYAADAQTGWAVFASVSNIDDTDGIYRILSSDLTYITRYTDVTAIDVLVLNGGEFTIERFELNDGQLNLSNKTIDVTSIKPVR